MALRFVDGFDTYPAASIATKWTSGGSSASFSGSGRFGGNPFTPGGFGSGNAITRTLDAQSTWVLGVAAKVSNVNFAIIFSLLDSGSLQCDLRMDSAGHLYATRNGTTLGTSTSAITSGVWYYIEFKALIHASAGTVDIHVNGVSWLSLTSQNTKATSNATANQVQLYGASNAAPAFDDFYCCDGTGGTNNDFLGDVRVESLKPDGAGNYAQFTPNGAGANYNCVNESSMDSDTTYNADATTGHIDTFSFGNMSSTPVTVFGVQTSLVARKDDAGSHTASALFRAGSTDYAQTAQSVPSSYAWLLTINETNPATGSAWTASEINALEAGYKLVS